MLLKVDAKARPFQERLKLEVNIDENLVLRATACSLNHKGRAEEEVHDLEFALGTPGASNGWLQADLLGADGKASSHEPGDLSMRSNLSAEEDHKLVPGEFMYSYNPSYFRVEEDPPKIQVEEHLYYEPCVICKRASNDPLCRCATTLGAAKKPSQRLNI